MSFGQPESTVGQRVGPYRIERLLGRGGMGTVYLAVREDDYEQKVAVKLVSRDAGGEEIIARFYTERQILAGLQHPGIARLLDGGVSDDGWPYLVMEYVEGERIDRYCGSHGLSVRERLELFRRVCQAVQFAHQSLVVHRDIKAGNIMVTSDGHPRLLDFGIAKVLGPDRGAASVTMPGLAPMTPSYASPEQIKNEPITTACDVYALGMLLYRLLAGRLPYRLEGLGFQEIVEVICRKQPQKPSVAVLAREAVWQDDRLTEITEATDEEGLNDTTIPFPADRREQAASAAQVPLPAVRLRRWSHRIAGDLDAIVLKALRKEPRERYGSAAELAEDLRRHLVGLPVHARQGTWVYNLGKFVRRNQLGLAVLAMIIGFAVATTFLWRQAVEEKEQAERQRARAERQQKRAVNMTEFMEGLFKLADPDEAKGEPLTVYEILRRGRVQVAEALAEELEDQAEILGTLARVYGRLGFYDEAVELRKEALAVRLSSDPKDRPALAKDINNLAHILHAVGDFQGAESKFREALAMRRRLGQEDRELTKNLINLASALERQGRYKKAEELHARVLRISEREYGVESQQVATSLYGLGILHTNLGDFQVGESLLHQALEMRSKIFGRKHTKVAELLNALGQALHAKGDHAQALGFFEESLAIRRKLFGDDHASVAQTRRDLAALHLDLGNVEKAGGLINQALATLRRTMPEGSSSILDSERVLGSYLLALGQYAEAESYLVNSYTKLSKIRGSLARPTQAALSRVIALYDAWGRPDQAAEYRAAANAILSRARMKKGS